MKLYAFIHLFNECKHSTWCSDWSVCFCGGTYRGLCSSSIQLSIISNWLAWIWLHFINKLYDLFIQIYFQRRCFFYESFINSDNFLLYIFVFICYYFFQFSYRNPDLYTLCWWHRTWIIEYFICNWNRDRNLGRATRNPTKKTLGPHFKTVIQFCWKFEKFLFVSEANILIWKAQIFTITL